MSDSPPDEPDIYLSRDELRGRGWTPGLMRRFLPIPETSRRSTTSSSKRIPLWSRETVETIEKSSAYRKAVARLDQAHTARLAGLQGKTVRKTEKEKLKAIVAIEAARSWPIHVEVCPIDRIRRFAIDEHIERASSCGEFRDRSMIKRDPAFMAEIVRTFVLRRLTDYDTVIRRYAWDHRQAEGAEILRRRYLDEIERMYEPFDEELRRSA